MKNILVVGGAGYIGSHMVWVLGQRGVNVVTLDNLSSGHRDAVLHGELVVGDMSDRAVLDRVFNRHRFDAVMHFASCIQVGESVADPAKYYINNVAYTLTLLGAMREHAVRQFVFSSSAAVFGEPRYSPLDERHPCMPINPYGRTKWMIEQALTDYGQAYGLRSVSLRYFNAAGAHPQALLGERHEPETHLVPLVLQAAAGRRPDVTVFGGDDDTPDGTCIRDYIHVMDLAEAHWQALRYLGSGGATQAFNLGNGDGYSVQQVIDTARAVTGRHIAVRSGPRRAGDPARLVANAALARKVLGWQPRHASLDAIVCDAWRWESRSGAGVVPTQESPATQPPAA